ncbi:alpha-ketoglutarate-dependent dioxygenase AlkB [Cucumibacter marinus]|uniref:alpha-ketoglutarate-dependent dioxygenase AlkB n=1 Tax=Cucumibacter marinus TaxID=1121252 RepID=UPI0003FE928F|nr:alpha-ketoglutarate-dependent dioxygenase AlkB [Cucumibacter marinus]
MQWKLAGTAMLPPDAELIDDFVTDTDAVQLLAKIDSRPWQEDLRRRVQHYGYRYDYRARKIAEGSYLGALPEWLADLAARLASNGLFADRPDQVIVNEYLPGQGIAAHVDCEPCFGDTIASLSLGSSSVMEFTELAGPRRLSAALYPNSLLILRGIARYGWRHGIAARKSDMIDGARCPRERRISLTFRTVVRG